MSPPTPALRTRGSWPEMKEQLFGLAYEAIGEHFAPVKVNDTLTFLFDDDSNFESHHYAFHVSDTEFDNNFIVPISRLRALPYPLTVHRVEAAKASQHDEALRHVP